MLNRKLQKSDTAIKNQFKQICQNKTAEVKMKCQIMYDHIVEAKTAVYMKTK